MKTVYGWKEQNEAAWGIETMTLEDEDYKNLTVLEGGEVYGDGTTLSGDGRWFKTFSAAKRAALEQWRGTLGTARIAIKEIQRQRKPR